MPRLNCTLFKKTRSTWVVSVFSLLFPIFSQASTFHVSPDLRIGPFAGSGITGGGIQLGMTDSFGFDAVYISYSQNSFEFITTEEKLATYRVGIQHQIESMPLVGFQVELGLVEYEGTYHKILSDSSDYRSGKGPSISFAWTLGLTDHIAFRAGGDINYIDRDNTHMPYSTSAMFTTGVIFQF